MREKADPDDGWFKVADDLGQALARADLRENEYAVCLWVMCHTYGVRRVVDGKFKARKFTPYSAYRIAAQTGRERSGLHRTIERLLSPERAVLRLNDRDEIGFNTRLNTWAKDIVRGDGWKLERGQASTKTETEACTAVHGGVYGGTRKRVQPYTSSPTHARGERREEESNTPTPQTRGAEVSLGEFVERLTAAYPKGKAGSPAKVARALRRLVLTPELADKIHASVVAHARSADWVKDDGRWVPGLGKFIRNEYWTRTPKALPEKGPKCQACYVKQAVPGAKVCAGCAWCVTCDEAGRESARPPAEIVVRDPGKGRVRMLCRTCAGDA